MNMVFSQEKKDRLNRLKRMEGKDNSDILSNFNDYISSGGADAAIYLLAAIVESSDDAILSKDLSGVITSWNSSAEKLYGYKRNEIIGRKVRVLYPPEKQAEFVEILKIIKGGGRVEHFDTVRMRKDGTRVEVSVSVSPILGPNGRMIGASSIARDITERKELDKRKDEFISVASHELKTPVTTIKAFNQVISSYLKDKNDPILRSYFEKMSDNVDRLVGLLNDLLDVSKIQSGKLELKMEKFDLDKLVKEIAFDLTNLDNSHKIIIKEGSGKKITADRYRVGQVLINLISNAIKYSPRSDKVYVSVRDLKDGVRVGVRDYGIGISLKDQKRIFERFFQVDNKIRESFSGLGLGLYISNEIVRRHGGEIGVKSTKGVGSTFSFILPFKSFK